VHARVKLYVHRISRYALLSGSVNKRIEQAEAVHLRLEVVVEHGLERRHLRVHNHDVRRYSSLAQRNTLVGNSHGKIVGAMVLQRLCHFHGTTAIGICLYHANHLRLRLEKRAEVVEVVHHGTEVHLEYGLVYFLLELFRKTVEREVARALEQYHLIAQRAEDIACGKRTAVGEEVFFGYFYPAGKRGYVRSDADEFFHTALTCKVRDLRIKLLTVLAALADVAQYQRAAASGMVGTAVHEVERDVERVYIRVVRVVYQRAPVLPRLHLQPHSHRLQCRHTRCQRVSPVPSAVPRRHMPWSSPPMRRR